MRLARNLNRRGFSLLEMVIALALGMILLLGLYMTLSVTVNHAETGREVMRDGAAARSIMTRINADIGNQIAPVDPRVLSSYGANGSASTAANYGNPGYIMTSPGGGSITNVLGVSNAYTENSAVNSASSTTSSSSTTSNGTGTGTGAGTTTGNSGASSGTSGASSSGTKSTTSNGGNSANSSNSGASMNGNSSGSSTGANNYNGNPCVYYNVGIRGDATSLVISTYRIQPGPSDAPTNAPDPVVTSDVTRVNYWLITNGNDAVGLARQEIKQATSNDIDLDIADISNPNQYLISDEVKNILFEYFDGTTWQPDWDGSTMTTGGSGQLTPIGPPVAIRVTVTLRRNTRNTPTISDTPDDATNTYVHIIPIRTSNNPVPSMAPTGGATNP